MKKTMENITVLDLTGVCNLEDLHNRIKKRWIFPIITAIIGMLFGIA